MVLNWEKFFILEKNFFLLGRYFGDQKYSLAHFDLQFWLWLGLKLMINIRAIRKNKQLLQNLC